MAEETTSPDFGATSGPLPPLPRPAYITETQQQVTTHYDGSVVACPRFLFIASKSVLLLVEEDIRVDTRFEALSFFFFSIHSYTEAEEAKERKKEKGKIFDSLQISGLLSKLPGWIISFNTTGVGINLNFAEFIRAYT